MEGGNVRETEGKCYNFYLKLVKIKQDDVVNRSVLADNETNFYRRRVLRYSWYVIPGQESKLKLLNSLSLTYT